MGGHLFSLQHLFMRMLLGTSNSACPVILRNDCVSDFSVIYCSMGSFPLQIDGCNMIPLGGQSPQEQHSQNVTQEGHTRRHKTLVMGVEAADFSRWVLRSTEAELCDCLEVPEKMGDSSCTESGGQGSPGGIGGVSNEISDVQGTSELDGAVGH